MNIKSIIASVSLLVAAGAAFAQAPSGQLTREQVIAETVAARAAGQLDRNDLTITQPFANVSTGTLSRADVEAQTVAARNAGTLDHNEAYDDIAYMTPSVRKADVKPQVATKTVKGGTTR